MNGLTLRVSNSGDKKSRNRLNISCVDVSEFISDNLVKENPVLSKFVNSKSTDEQLVELKNILDCIEGDMKASLIQFLASLFFETESKHPVKCFLVRHISRNPTLGKVFTNSLATEIGKKISKKPSCYKEYAKMVSKLSGCMENFAPGFSALEVKEIEVIGYLDSCLHCCIIDTLINTTPVSPTEKNEIFNLCHSALRILLHIYSHSKSHELLNERFIIGITSYIQQLLFDEDVPMDTKSICGILYLTLLRLENGNDIWLQILKKGVKFGEINLLLSTVASQLSIYSAIATVVSVETLQYEKLDGNPVLLVLIQKILHIGDCNSSDSVFVLGVTRTLLQISKGLDKITNGNTGLALMDSLLSFIWSHLEHHMDSVRHLTAQMLTNVVKYCSKLDRDGDTKAIENLFAVLKSLDRSRKSFYVTLTALIADVGAIRVLKHLPVMQDVMAALSVQAVQATATTTLEMLLQKHIKECTIEVINREWIDPILHHVTNSNIDNGVMNILENILIKAVKFNEEIITLIIPHIKQSDSDLKCILMLVRVVRNSNVTKRQTDGEWRGIIDYNVMEEAAVDISEETRILSLSLIVESPKTTEVFTEGELKFVLKFLQYNANAQSPNFRQLVLSMMKKFMKRLEDSYKVLKKQKVVTEEVYINFLEDLRSQCFGNLLPGANYSRRVVSLQILVWSEKIDLCGYERKWSEEYIEKLLMNLEDSYENNKAYALEVLDRCPTELLKTKTYSTSLDLSDILKQASSMKPTDCVAAAYKLDLIRRKLPERILEEENSDIPEAVLFTLLQKLHEILCKEQDICQKSIVRAAVNAPMYGVVHCMVHFMAIVDVVAIASEQRWGALISDIIDTCIKVNSAVECVVNNSSPEGHLPMDMGGVKDHGNESGIRLENGRQVTAQMVLLCAWRSVKEVSLLLGEISSRLSIQSEYESGTLRVQHMVAIGEHFTKLLAETKHRGAFEQAYVGFTKLLARLWRCRNIELHSLPRVWLSELKEAIASGDKRGSLCATRRSAGLPFMIQALVTTELQVHGNPKYFHECMTLLLRLARSPTNSVATTETAVEARTHSINILRALFRNSALNESVSGYVGDGLMVALEGFEGSTWMERNSSTLLFSALTVRVFGVQRSKDSDNLCIRNRMTGRIFFLRYPQLYDFMLNKLKEVTSANDDNVLRPSLYPVLLLLARLYPSSLEGTVSNLKLVTFIPHVLSCAKSGVLKTRQLAAKAMLALVPPEQYLHHVEEMLELIQQKQIKRNYCHGILLQLIRLLDHKPESLTIDNDTKERLSGSITKTMWILDQSLGDVPCWLLLDEYVKMINLLVWRFPTVLTEDGVLTLKSYLHKILFNKRKPDQINSGKDVALRNTLYLYLIILNKYEMISIFDVILKSLNHDSYEVKLAMLNFILNLYDSFEHETKLEEHLIKVSNRNVLGPLREGDKYQEALCEVFKNSKYQECKLKCLKVLSLMDNKERLIVEMKVGTKIVNDDIVLNTLIEFVKNEHENLTYIYLDTLCNLVRTKLLNSKMEVKNMLEVLKLIYTCASSDNNYDTRSIVLKFYENYHYYVLNIQLDGLDDFEKFEYKATFYATIVTSLEDDDDVIRHRAAYVIARLTNGEAYKVLLASKSAEMLRDYIASSERDGVAILMILALLDFNSEVCLNGDVSDECRVFDQNERYNMFLEETIWTAECADKILQISKKFCTNITSFIQNIIELPVYRNSLEILCGNNFVVFEKLFRNCKYENSNLINPKVKLLIDKLLL